MRKTSMIFLIGNSKTLSGKNPDHFLSPEINNINRFLGILVEILLHPVLRNMSYPYLYILKISPYKKKKSAFLC